MRTMLAARAEDSSQLVGYCAVAIGKLSVKPSTWIGFSNGFKIAATLSMMVNAWSLGIASALANSRLELSSISTHNSLPRTVIWLDLIRSPKAALMSSAMLFSGSLVPPMPTAVSSLSLTSGLAGVTVLGRSSPMGIGLRERSASLNTPISAWEMTLYLPSLIEEMEYITTKNAKDLKSTRLNSSHITISY